MVDVVVAHRPRMERDGAHLRRPADDGDLGRADLVGVPARRERDPRGLDVVGRSARDALLEEGVAAALLPRRQHDARVHALGPPLERRRTPRERAHDPVLDGEVVLDDVELGHGGRALGRREDHAIGAAHAQLASPGVDGRALLRCHGEVLRECAPGRERRRRDSNPRQRLTPCNALAGRRLQPLGHFSRAPRIPAARGDGVRQPSGRWTAISACMPRRRERGEERR